MAETKAMVMAPELRGDLWINTEPLRAKDLRGRVVLVDFWDYTCVNCLRTLPYLREWHRRYQEKGLTIIGVHTPEFEFAGEFANVKEAVQRLGIEYPVLLDSDYANWSAYANQYWPHEYLIDAAGAIRYDHIGEGGYGETESAIQALLAEAHPGLVLPPVMGPVTRSEMPGAVCYRTTPELYAGYSRGRLGNPEGHVPDAVKDYEDPVQHEPDAIYLQGPWESRAESVRHARTTQDLADYAALRYHAIEVSAVIRPQKPEPFRVYVLQDGQPLLPESKGEDIFYDEDHRAYLLIDEPRMYRVVDNPQYGTHDLTLATNSDAFALYAFTFGGCARPGKP